MESRVAVAVLTICLGCTCWGRDVAISAFATTTRPRNLYPNELPGLKFYAKYLAPLRPYVSGRTLVIHVLGVDEGFELRRWKITPLFVGEGGNVNGHPWVEDVTGRLASVSMTPKQRVSMLGVRFPAAFTHGSGNVSEGNVICDVYSDSFGLHYWLYAEDSAVGMKGDLMEIVYGPSRGIERQAHGPS
jgi:hypothetical protein